MNETDRKKIEERLIEEREDRLETLAEFDDRFKERLESGELTHYPLHMADEGTDTMEQEKDFLLAHNEGEQLLEIDESLRTLYREPDAFGVCRSCGEPIAVERLEVVPWAKRCLACQEKAEAGPGGRDAGS
jgi:RNA polymerase-binding transcription factor DksA